MTARSRRPAPGGWEWLDAAPTGVRLGDFRFRCGLRHKASPALWAAMDVGFQLASGYGRAGHACVPWGVCWALYREALRLAAR